MFCVRCCFSLYDYNEANDKYTKVAKHPRDVYRNTDMWGVIDVQWIPQTMFDGIEVRYYFNDTESARYFMENLTEDFKYANPTIVG